MSDSVLPLTKAKLICLQSACSVCMSFKVLTNFCPKKLRNCFPTDFNLYIFVGEKYCPAFWDDIFCWPPTLAGTLAVTSCPKYVVGLDKWVS